MELSQLDKLSTNAKTIDQTSAAFMQPEPPKEKKSRGRPALSEEEKKKKAEEQKQKASAQKSTLLGSDQPQQSQQSQFKGPSPEMMMITKPAATFISNMGVNYVGDKRAQMTPDELEAVASGLAMVADKYLPSVMNNYGAEAALIIALGTYSMRVMAMKKVLEHDKKVQAQRFQTPQPEPRPVDSYSNDTTKN